jgi:general secretion pathway protein B
MSYILDALRKSDQQRQRGVPPTLLAPQAAAVEPGRRLPVSYAVLTVVLIGAGVVIGALRPWQTEQATKSPGRNPLESTARESAVPAQPRATGRPEQDVPISKVKPPIPSAAVLSDGAAQETEVPAAAQPETKLRTPKSPPQAMPTAPQRITRAAPTKPQAASATTSAEPQKLLTMAELPLSIRQEMPPLSISVHAYSREPKDRLIGINDRVLHEGENLAPGLRLEEITPNGMILRYKGYRFLRGVR